MQNLYFTMNYMYMYYGRARCNCKEPGRMHVSAGRSDMSVQKVRIK